MKENRPVRDEAIRVIRGLVLAEAAAQAGRDAVHTEDPVDDFDTEQVRIRVFIGQRSTLLSFEGIDGDHVQSDIAVWRKVERQIKDAVTDLQAGA